MTAEEGESVEHLSPTHRRPGPGRKDDQGSTGRLTGREEEPLTRRLIAPLAALLTLVLVGPPLDVAQAAAPTAGWTAGAAGLTRTDARYFLPYGRAGLKAGLTVVATDGGACAHESLVAPGRPVAWDCLGRSGNTVYDPCFEDPFADRGARTHRGAGDRPPPVQNMAPG